MNAYHLSDDDYVVIANMIDEDNFDIFYCPNDSICLNVIGTLSLTFRDFDMDEAPYEELDYAELSVNYVKCDDGMDEIESDFDENKLYNAICDRYGAYGLKI